MNIEAGIKNGCRYERLQAGMWVQKTKSVGGYCILVDFFNAAEMEAYNLQAGMYAVCVDYETKKLFIVSNLDNVINYGW